MCFSVLLLLIVARDIILFMFPSSSGILNVIVLESVSLLPIKTDKKTRLSNQDSKVQKPNDCVANFLILLYHSVDSDRMVGEGKPRPRVKGYFRRIWRTDGNRH